MIAHAAAYALGRNRRLLWSLLASAVLNALAWVMLPVHLARRTAVEAPERLVVTASFIRTEHRRASARPRAAAPPQETAMLAPPPPAALALPQGWSRQDLAFLGTTKTAEWLNWSKSRHSDKWVPRVFVWQMPVKPGYMHAPSLSDAVQQILDTLHEDATISASRPQRVCSGERDGWFLSYVKADDDPPLHYDETLLMQGQSIYRAIYIRAVDQPEDTTTRAALSSLCAA
jgi:hypothetical protein